MKHSKHLQVGAVVVTVVAILIILIGYLRQVPVSLNIEPATATTSIDGKTIRTGEKTGFGSKQIKVEAPNFVPYQVTKKLGLFSNLRLNLKLRPLPQANKISDGDLLTNDLANNLFYRSGGQLYLATSAREAGFPISGTNFSNLTEIVFSPDGELAWTKFDDGSNGILDFNRYNLTNQELIHWETGITTAVWQPESKVSDPENQRLIYLKDGIFFRSDPLRKKVERLLDLNPEGISDAQMGISSDGQLIILVANQNLYFFNTQVLALTKVAQGNVSSATFEPNGTAILYNQNNQLVYQKFSIAPLGKIVVEPLVTLEVSGQASDGFFDSDGKQFVVIAQNAQPPTPGGRGPDRSVGIAQVDLGSKTVTQLHHQPLPQGARALKKFNDSYGYLQADGAIYSIKLDRGDY